MSHQSAVAAELKTTICGPLVDPWCGASLTTASEAWDRTLARWMVVQTVPNSEHKVRFRLQDQGYVPFLPVYLRMTRHARQIKTVQAPYFSGYLFVEFEPGVTPCEPIRNTKGVLQVIGDTSGRPVPVPVGVVEQLQEIAGRNGGNIPVDDQPALARYRRGDRVKVIEGPFESYEGIFDRDEDKRVRVLISMFRGGAVPMLMDESHLRPAKG